jgi:hypothetical protein
VHRFLHYKILLPLALILGLAPLTPEPHLTEKIRLLLAGNLRRPLDMFDLLWHAWPLLLLGFRLGRDLGRRYLPAGSGS